MSERFRIKTIRMESGERLPLMLRVNGTPDWHTTLYSLTMQRSRGLSQSTIENSLRAIKVLYLFLAMNSISLEERLKSQSFLSDSEVARLVDYCKLPTIINPRVSSDSSIKARKVTPFLSKEKIRLKSPQAMPSVSLAHAATRIMYIRQFLVWRVDNYSTCFSGSQKLTQRKNSLLKLLSGLSPSSGNYAVYEAKEGLSPEVYEELFKIIQIDSPSNPWKEEFTRVRNELIVFWFFYLGIRRGELLNIHVSDVLVAERKVKILRRPTNALDKRKKQPLVKTRSRELPLSDFVLTKTMHYIQNYRSVIPLTRKHPFLFVNKNGLALTLDGCGNIFRVLRQRCPNMPTSLSPHDFRRTWNDNFSRLMDSKGTDPEKEKKTRSYLMGWKETSNTAAVYTRRHIREKAEQVSLTMQSQLPGEKKDE